MDPNVWGPSFWFVLHTVSFNYPEHPNYVIKRTHHDFYRIIQHILPCKACRKHYKELFNAYPIEPFLTSRQSLMSWVVMIHNQVNKRIGKPMLTTQEVITKYKDVYTRGSFCDPAQCNEDEEASRDNSHKQLSSQTSPALIAVYAGSSTVAVLLLLFSIWYFVRRLRTIPSSPI